MIIPVTEFGRMETPFQRNPSFYFGTPFSLGGLQFLHSPRTTTRIFTQSTGIDLAWNGYTCGYSFDLTGKNNYAFQGTSGNKPTYTLQNGVWVLDFDSSGDWLSIINSSALYTAPLAIVMHCKFDSLPSTVGQTAYLFNSSHTTTPYHAFTLWCSVGSDKFRWVTVNSSGTNYYTDSNAAISVNTTYRIIATINSSFTTSLFVNEVKQTDTDTPGSLLTPDLDINIGNRKGTGRNFSGQMLDYMLYAGAEAAWINNASTQQRAVNLLNGWLNQPFLRLAA